MLSLFQQIQELYGGVGQVKDASKSVHQVT